MPDLKHLLDQIDRLDKKTTKGPWVYDDNALGEVLYRRRSKAGEYAGTATVVELATDYDGEFIALARTALPQLAKALREVKAVVERTRAQYIDYNASDFIALGIADDIDHAITDALKKD